MDSNRAFLTKSHWGRIFTRYSPQRSGARRKHCLPAHEDLHISKFSVLMEVLAYNNKAIYIAILHFLNRRLAMYCAQRWSMPFACQLAAGLAGWQVRKQSRKRLAGRHADCPYARPSAHARYPSSASALNPNGIRHYRLLWRP